MRSLKAILGLAVMAFILAGCGGGTNSASSGPSASASSSSSPVSSGSGSGSGSGTGTSSPTGSATLAWQAPTTNTNGTPLTDLAGYYIYYGNSAGAMTNKINVSNPGTVTYVVSNLSAGTWYFGVVAYTNTGLQSSMSNVGSKTIT